MLNIIDFKVFKYDWMCVIVEPFSRRETVIINDAPKLKSYYETHKNEYFVGHNIRLYDQYIFKSILLGINPKNTNDKIMIDKIPGWKISQDFQRINLKIYDTMASTKTQNSLKTLEAFMGHNIHECSIDFDIERKLNQDEINSVVEYCKNDVYECLNVFINEYDEFKTVVSLIDVFKLPNNYTGKTKSQLAATILDCKKTQRNDEWDIKLIPTLSISKYKNIVNWFLCDENHDYDNYTTAEILGIEHTFAWGGLHGARAKYHSNGIIWHIDAESYYPSIMIEYNLLSRNVSNPVKFRNIRDRRIAYKKEGNKMQLPYKVVINATYGICKDKNSTAYDPRNANLVCINGQLLLLDLLEKLELNCQGIKLIQTNTDGIIVECSDKNCESKMMQICNEWMTRTKINLKFDEIEEIWQKDVNNYIFKFKNGEFERKGCTVKEKTILDNDLPIVNECVFRYFTEYANPVQIVNECTELIKFQKIVKISSKYNRAWHNNIYMNDKTYRVFASTNKNDTYIGKQKTTGGTIEKFANTPDHCFIDNGDILNKPIPAELDRQYYIDLIFKKINEFCEF